MNIVLIALITLAIISAGVGLFFVTRHKDDFESPSPNPKAAPEIEDIKAIRGYMALVYPNVDWSKTNASKLSRLYDNLSFYYNPCSSYKKNNLSGVNNNQFDKNAASYGQLVAGTGWDPLPSCELLGEIRAPRGRFLSFETYEKSNVTDIILTGKESLKDNTSYRQTLHWGTTSNGGEVSRTCRSGPGPYWITTFSLVRNIYYPNGIMFNEGKWSLACNMSSKLFNHGCEGDVEWTMGKKEGEYIEVQHSGNVPGMSQSIGYWFNGFPNGGTGVFLEIGVTRVANNKVDMLYKLLLELYSTSAHSLHDSMKDTKFAGMSGLAILLEMYQTTDIDVIVWKYINGEWEPKAFTKNGYPVVDPRDDSWAYIGNKGILSASGLMSDPQSIAVEGPDDNGYTPNMTVKFSDIARWWLGKTNTDTPLTTDDTKRVIAAAREPENPKDYFPNRAGGMVTPDEPMCWLAFVLQIETLQMPLSANDNGLWCYEIIDLRLPMGDFYGIPEDTIDRAKERTYTFLTTPHRGQYHTAEGSGGAQTATGIPWPVWTPEMQKAWSASLVRHLSSKSPDNKIAKVTGSYTGCHGTGYVALEKAQCHEDAFPTSRIDLPPGLFNFGGEYGERNRLCWTAVPDAGWRNLPCHKDSLSHQYVKVPLVFPAIRSKAHGLSAVGGPSREYYLRNVTTQLPPEFQTEVVS